MKKITLVLSLFVCFSSLVFAQNKSGDKIVFGKKIKPENITPSGHIRCASTEYEQYLREQNPKMETREQFENWMAQKIKEYKDLQQVSSQSGGIIYIPVVVHVIHNGDAYGTNENITDEQVQSQITVMTQDFRRMAGTPGENSNPVGADTQIEFVLAKVDPNGNPTNGINRINLCQESWSTAAINSTVKPTTSWDPTQYMNMWSVNFTDGSLLGYAQFPSSSGLTGLNANGGAANTDGVVAGYRFFGSSDLTTGNFAAPFDKGRTMTHEVGHFLGLRHIWAEDGAACSADDYCADTPMAASANGGCPTGTDTCPSAGFDMIENYMDYTDDACMNIFTNDQKTRITTVMNNSPRRSTLKTSTKDVAIPLFANDAEVKIEAYCSTGASSPCAPANQHKVYLYNRGTANMTSATINYNVNGGANTPVNWTGNLAPNAYALVSFSTVQSSGTLNVSVASVNGGADARSTNNTNSKAFSFTAPTAPADHPYTTFAFNLIGDRYGTETSWALKNATGTTLYSGGPYTNLAANGTQTLVNNQSWSLPANGCYELTVYDSYGDGIRGPYGNGSFTVTANSGAVSVVNDITFANGFSVTYYFKNTALSADSFDLLDAVVLFPNPSKDFFTIDVPAGLAKSGKMEIYNNIGQKVATKTISSDADLTVNVSNFSNGVYFLNLNLGDASKTLKFIKE